MRRRTPGCAPGMDLALATAHTFPTKPERGTTRDSMRFPLGGEPGQTSAPDVRLPALTAGRNPTRTRYDICPLPRTY